MAGKRRAEKRAKKSRLKMEKQKLSRRREAASNSELSKMERRHSPKQELISISKIRPERNDKCPCGSEIKFKRCCQRKFDETSRSGIVQGRETSGSEGDNTLEDSTRENEKETGKTEKTENC